MKIIDISWPLTEDTVGYKNHKKIEFKDLSKFDQANIRATRMRIGAHDGTHVDAPAHFIKEGKTIDQFPVTATMGEAVVLEMSHVGEVISGDDLAKHEIKEGQIVLLKTTNSALSHFGEFNKGFVYLDASGAHYLVEKKVKAVGIDYLGIERNQKGHGTHIELFRNNVMIIEGLRLAAVQAGEYFLCCLPIDVIGLASAPARAVLVQHQD